MGVVCFVHLSITLGPLGTLSYKEFKYSTCVLGHSPWIHKTMSQTHFIKKVARVIFCCNGAACLLATAQSVLTTQKLY